MWGGMGVGGKVVVGYWKDEQRLCKIGVWMGVCGGWGDCEDMVIVGLGEEMKKVGVSEGEKVEGEEGMG